MRLILGSVLCCVVCLQSVTPLRAADLERGVSLYGQKNYAEAEKALREVVSAEPENSRALQYLGLTLIESQKPAEAVDVLTKAAAAAPSSDAIQVALGRAYLAQKDFDKADAALKRAREINADNPDLPYNLGMVELQRKNYGAAAQDFEKVLVRDPNNAYAHYYAGLAYNGLKQPDKMTSHFEHFLKLAPDAPEAAKVRSATRMAR
jgi:protein O-GlcNAc transferase